MNEDSNLGDLILCGLATRCLNVYDGVQVGSPL
jgi:hypothetical protein